MSPKSGDIHPTDEDLSAGTPDLWHRRFGHRPYGTRIPSRECFPHAEARG